MARTTRVVLLTGDYADRLQELADAAALASADETPLLNGEAHPYDEIRAEYEALKAEAEAKGITVELTAIGRRAWRDLKTKHPARTEGDEDAIKGDKAAGVNIETVEDDLVAASVTSPEHTTRADFDAWADTLSEGEWQVLVVKSWELANGARLDPKDLPALPTRSNSQN